MESDKEKETIDIIIEDKVDWHHQEENDTMGYHRHTKHLTEIIIVCWEDKVVDTCCDSRRNDSHHTCQQDKK